MNFQLRENFTEIGKSALRVDGRPKGTGQTLYTGDLTLPGMIWGKCLRSPFPHARILHIDTSDSKRVKGVLAVLTAADIPTKLIGRRLKDTPVLAQGTVRFIGEKVAAVAADTLDIAEDALSRIHVEYEELKAAYHPEEAMLPETAVIHENLRSYENLRLPLPDIPNVHSHIQWTYGDTERAFTDAEFIFEQTFRTQRVHHGYLEPHAVIAAIDPSGRVLIWYPAKGPYATRQQFAEWLGVPESMILFQLTSVGGDFGGKGSLMDIPICYCLAKAAGRPVKMIMTYFEELTAGNPRHPSVITIKTGVKKDGKLWAREVRAIFNSGAYAGFKNNETINLPGARHGAGAYYIPNVKIDAFSVYTNCVPSGIMRGPGEAQMIFAVECHTDYIARELGRDPHEFRYLNVLKRGDPLPYGVHLASDKGKEVLEKLAANLHWKIPRHKKPFTGRGLAFCVREIGVGEANVEVGLREDGSLYILTTVPDTGTGSHTIFRQIVAEICRVPASKVEVISGTTDSFSSDVMVAASRVTCVAGQATQRAASGLRDLLIGEAAQHFGCAPESVRLSKSSLRGPKQRKIAFSELAIRTAALGRSLIVRENYKAQTRGGVACFFAQAAEVKVDPETGEVKVLKIVSAYDVGTIINPMTHQGQVEGGMIQGLGFALIEHLLDEEGRIVTANLGEYKLPNIMDIPLHGTVLVQDHEGPGPYHSKPIGEHGAVPTAPAIANAIYDAIGVQMKDLPLTAEKVYFQLCRYKETNLRR